jgi:uncharacterized repeat protein (TIGR03803 family)
MKKNIQSVAASAIVLTAGAMFALSAHAGGTFTQKYLLPVVSNTAPNGAWPRWELVKDLANTAMYGVTPAWGATQGGTLFSVTTAGAFVKVRDFGAAGDVNGSKPNGPVLWVGGALYGVTELGGTNAVGVLYKWTAPATYQVLYSFGSGSSGAKPSGPLLKANDGFVYGTTGAGGACNQGSVFKLNLSTNAVAVLYSFCGQDGVNPMTGVIQSTDGNLYGTTYTGGAFSSGTLFRLTLAGTFTRLYDFGSDATQPKFPSRLIQAADGLLYGTSYAGGDITFGKGALFSSTLAGVVTVRQRFANAPNGMSNPSPWAALNERFTGILYGITAGQNGGNIFQFRASNSTVTNIYNFAYPAASWPEAGLALGPDGNLWGNTTDSSNLFIRRAGTIYSIQSLTANP